METKHKEKRIDTTLGDLIVAVSDAAFEFCEDKQASYLAASLALDEILNKGSRQRAEMGETSGEPFPEGIIFH